jgi:hypothetical protein
MITPQEIRTAICAPDADQALERLARRELHAGRSRRELSDDIALLQPEVREFPEYEDEWEDRLADLVDKLTGWTMPATQLHPE